MGWYYSLVRKSSFNSKKGTSKVKKKTFQLLKNSSNDPFYQNQSIYFSVETSIFSSYNAFAKGSILFEELEDQIIVTYKIKNNWYRFVNLAIPLFVLIMMITNKSIEVSTFGISLLFLLGIYISLSLIFLIHSRNLSDKIMTCMKNSK